MGNLCYSTKKDPTTKKKGKEISTGQEQSVRIQRTDSQQFSNVNQYKDNVLGGEISQKKINPRKFCRGSKVIQERSMNNIRDTEYSNCFSELSGNYESGNFASAAISTFIMNQEIGQKIKIGDEVIIKNLKEQNFLFCKYKKIRNHDKQNLVKLEKQFNENNEMYFTWKIQADLPQEDPLNFQQIKLEHTVTRQFLQSNSRWSKQVGPENGQLASCGQQNKLTKDQVWGFECLQQNQQFIGVNSLFRIKHQETGMYLTAYSEQVCCLSPTQLNNYRIKKGGIESNITSQMSETEKGTPATNLLDVTRPGSDFGKNSVDKKQIDGNWEVFDDKTNKQNKIQQEILMKQETREIENLINDIDMGYKEDSFLEEALINKSQVQQQQLSPEEQEAEKKKMFEQAINDADIWYVSEIICNNNNNNNNNQTSNSQLNEQQKGNQIQ